MHASLASALASLRDRRPDDAWTSARLVLAERPEDAFALAVAACALRLLGRSSTAELFQRRAAAAALPLFPAADDIEFMRQMDELNAGLTAGIDDDKLQARRLANEGAAWHHQGFVGKAERCFQTALDLDPVCGPAHYHRGLLAADLGKTAVARNCFLRAIHADPDFISARVALGRLAAGQRPAPVSA